MKNQQKVVQKTIVTAVGLVVLSLVGVSGIAGRAVAANSSGSTSSSQNSAAQVTQTYNAGTGVLPGMLVEVDSNQQNQKNQASTNLTVVPLKAADIVHMLGVALSPGNSPLVLTNPSETGQQLLVSSSGRLALLVSTQNGAIKTGDYLTVSALPGVAMKADTSESRVIGQALSNFDGSNSLGTSTLNKSSGGTVNVAIGSLTANIQLSDNPIYHQQTTSLPGYISGVASTITKKPVSAARIYISVIIFLSTVFMVGTVLYGGTKTSITAVGRNPLAKRVISMSLFKTMGGGLIIMAIGLVASYLIITV